MAGLLNPRSYLLAAPALGFLLLFFVVPLCNILLLSITEPTLSWANYRHIFAVPLYLRVLANTFRAAAIVTAICGTLAYPLATTLVRRQGWGVSLLLACVMIPFWTGFLVRTFAWFVIFGSHGPLANLMRAIGIARPPQMLFTSFAALWGLTHILLPFMVLAFYTAMKRIDPQLLRAATSLGASPLRAFWHVFVPLSAPGVVNGCILVFTMCLGFYATPALLGSPRDMMLSQLIAQQVEELLNWGFAAALAVVLMLCTSLALLLTNRVFGLRLLFE